MVSRNMFDPWMYIEITQPRLNITYKKKNLFDVKNFYE